MTDISEEHRKFLSTLQYLKESFSELKMSCYKLVTLVNILISKSTTDAIGKTS